MSFNTRVLLITPPLTQLNSPYPATMYLTGFLKSMKVPVQQVDLGIKMINSLFTQSGLSAVFAELETLDPVEDAGLNEILDNKQRYIDTIEPVARFLKNQDQSIAYRICAEQYLPQGPRFSSVKELDWMFGEAGVVDRAKYLSTLFLEDIVDAIREYIVPGFGFARYEEQVGLFAKDFSEVDSWLKEPENLIDQIFLSILDELISENQPDIIGFTVPFPGCLFAALKCCQRIKEIHVGKKTVMGGGFVNSELRSLKNSTFFEYVDFLTFDKGERALYQIVKYVEDKCGMDQLVRTMMKHESKVSYFDNADDPDVTISCSEMTPDYTGVHMEEYLSILDVVNPMHRLWNDGRWNKLELSHGCYWAKCAFCDTQLEYIKNYEEQPAVKIVDKIEAIIRQTGQTGFHFVDEAASPKTLKNLAGEILKRRLQITWWANIRFERSFNEELCRLLFNSGCIAVTGGLETANDRLLKLMKKGISLAPAIAVCANFRNAGIMTHCYLMYGFPTETREETIDSLEIVRQMFHHNLIQSAFWHRFALTAHSYMGRNPEKFGLKVTGPENVNFAFNELRSEEPGGIDHSIFSEGLSKAIFNYMHGIGLDEALDFWFDFEVPDTTVPKNFVKQTIKQNRTNTPIK